MTSLTKTAVVLGIAITLLTAAGATGLEPFAHTPYLELQVDDGEGVLKPVSHNEMEIDASLVIEWKEAELRAKLAEELGLSETPGAEKRLAALSALVKSFLEAQGALAEFKAVSPTGSISTATEIAASDQFGKTADQALDDLDAYMTALRDEGNTTGADELEEAANTAILEDYAALANVLRADIRDLAQSVAEALENATPTSMQMRATLVSTTGTRRLHLEGYDKIATFAPQETPRFQLVLDQRATAEIAAAEGLRQVVEQVTSGQLKQNLEGAWSGLRAELDRLTEAVENDVLKANIQTVLDQLKASGEAQFKDLESDGEQLVGSLEDLELDDLPPTLDDAQTLVSMIRNVTTQASGVIAGLKTIDTRLDAFSNEVKTALDTLPGTIEAGAMAEFEQSVATFKANADVAAVTTAFREVRTAFGLAADVAGDVLDAVEEIPRDALTADLGTRIDLMTAGERHTGELIILESELSQGDGDDKIVLSTNFQRIRIRKFGLSVGPRGALFFTDPEKPSLADQAWEPSPGMAFMAHFGKRGSNVWNDVFDPGIGIALTMLDHVDEDDAEIGVAVTLSVFRSLIWVGYGRNIQAESDFVSFGVNPLVIGAMWREKAGGAALP